MGNLTKQAQDFAGHFNKDVISLLKLCVKALINYKSKS